MFGKKKPKVRKLRDTDIANDYIKTGVAIYVGKFWSFVKGVGAAAVAGLALWLTVGGGCERMANAQDNANIPSEGDKLKLSEPAKDTSTTPAKRLASITGVKGVYSDAAVVGVMPKGKAQVAAGDAAVEADLDHSHG